MTVLHKRVFAPGGTLRAACVAGVAAVAIGAATPAAVATTAPSSSVLIEVLITEKGIIVAKWVGSATHNGMLVLAGPVPRGDYISINVLNRGKKVHDLTIFGKKTPPIRPGKKAHLFYQAIRRGTFTYRSTLDRGKTFQGSIIVA